MTTNIDIINRSLVELGVQAQITGLPPADKSPAAQAAAVLYEPIVDMVLRQAGWDAGRDTATLVTAAGANAQPMWQFVYAYPSGCMQVRQVFQPPTDPNDPQPFVWAVAVDTALVQRVVLANISPAFVVFTVRPNENDWDSILQEAVVRSLASPLSISG